MTYVLCGETTYGQDISGTWVGFYGKESNRNQYGLKFDIEVYNDSLIKGIRTQYFNSIDRYECFTISGVYNKAHATVYIVEEDTVHQTVSGYGDKGTYELKLETITGKITLVGKWKNATGGLFTSQTSKVWMEKTLTDTPHTPKPVVKKPPSEDKALTRATNVVDKIYIEASELDSIQIDITDDNEVDGDLVSLYVDDKTVLYKKELSYTPITYLLQLDASTGRKHSIKMIAEHTGSMPPCTAKMVITTPKNLYIVKIASNYRTNGAVEFILLDQ
ncbi:MAG: hypothetical protein H6551_12305 [Chitinophagales bacterium]|nr:hypothetical protein [Chitinophagaceae bacterium]MCB9065912.1 hypothetical protein [Chitinophagales bacterium]